MESHSSHLWGNGCKTAGPLSLEHFHRKCHTFVQCRPQSWRMLLAVTEQKWRRSIAVSKWCSVVGAERGADKVFMSQEQQRQAAKDQFGRTL